MKRQFKVRFNLGAGIHFMHWRVENRLTKEVQYFNPNEVSFELTDCYLRNQKATANKINNGANKSVCAWIECNAVTMTDCDPQGNNVSYNPRIAPNWLCNDTNVDGKRFGTLLTKGNKVFIGN
jgi:hypothetical protein